MTAGQRQGTVGLLLWLAGFFLLLGTGAPGTVGNVGLVMAGLLIGVGTTLYFLRGGGGL